MTEFDDVIQRLEADRPMVTDRELDAIKQRVRRRAADPSRRSQSMKSRLAILAMLVTGMLFSTAGVGLALQGGGSNASFAQYAECTPTPAPQSGTVSPTDTGSTQQGRRRTATSARRAASSRPRRPRRPAPRPSPRKAASCRPRRPSRRDAAGAPAGGRGRDEPAAVHRLRGDPRPARRPRAARRRPDPAPPHQQLEGGTSPPPNRSSDPNR